MYNGVCLYKLQFKLEGLGFFVELIFEFVVGLFKLKLDKIEFVLFVVVLLM